MSFYSSANALSCCFFLLPLFPPSQYQTNSPQSTPQSLPLVGAEKNEAESDKLLVTREDLLSEGYEKRKRAWTEEEDALLLQLCADENARFEDIARLVPGKNAKMCYSRFRRLSNQAKDCWKRAEDQKLQRLVREQGPQWKELAAHFPNRNHKQLKDHYENYLRPGLANSEWTLQEDLQLVSLFNERGKDWKYIQQALPHRSRNQIKNRFFGRIQRIHAKNSGATLRDSPFAQ